MRILIVTMAAAIALASSVGSPALAKDKRGAANSQSCEAKCATAH
jgi:hypothetical protein